jgi:aminopeptidase
VRSVDDPRIDQYATLLVDRCLGVEAGWQVVVKSRPEARPLVQAITREIAHRGAYALLRINFGPWDIDPVWLKEAPLELVERAAPVEANAYESIDAWINVTAPEDPHEGLDVSNERDAAYGTMTRPFLTRRLSFTMPWVGCHYPTQALADEAGMTLAEYTDFLLGACLLDWDAEAERMRKYKERFDGAREVRIVGEGTDLKLSLEGREGMVDEGRFNMPGGEFFFSPVETATEGVIEFAEFPAVRIGRYCEGVRLVFEGGRVVDASARTNEDYLFSQLDADDGARVLGELGVGCNPGIQRHTKDVLFDEKIDGTIHLAVGAGFPFLGGTNTSAVHWDMVKDLRNGGRIEIDGELVQESGAWRI